MSVTSKVQTLLESSAALISIAGNRIRVVGPGPAPQTPFILHGAVRVNPVKTHDGIPAFAHDYEVLFYSPSHSQCQQVARILSQLMVGTHADISIIPMGAEIEFDEDLKLHTCSFEAKIYER